MSSNNFQIFEDNTATPPTRYPSNQNNQFVLQPSQHGNSLPGYVSDGQRVREATGFYPPIPQPVLSGQENATTSQPVHNAFNINGWMAQNVPAGTNTHLQLLTPQQLHTAYNSSFAPIRNPATIATTPHGYQVEGNWHIGQFQNAINKRMARPIPDIVPFWTANGLIRQDQAYRAGPPIPATIWPTPAVRMTMHMPTIQVAQQNGMHLQAVNQQGHVQWIWQGRQ